jgi:hypothetical protein
LHTLRCVDTLLPLLLPLLLLLLLLQAKVPYMTAYGWVVSLLARFNSHKLGFDIHKFRCAKHSCALLLPRVPWFYTQHSCVSLPLTPVGVPGHL